MHAHRLIALVAPLLAAAALVGCGGSDESGDGDAITAWTLENQPDRLAAQKRILQRFTDRTGVKVELRGIDEDQLRTLISSAAAGGSLPDVMLALPLSYADTLAAQQLSDPDEANAIVDELGRETFAERALTLVGGEDGKALAVPADAWGQMILYRTDLFEQAGLAPPDTFDALLQAAKRLHRGGMAGIALPTTPNDTFTQESFEQFALANGCQLVGAGDELTLATDPCRRALAFYTELATRYSVPGNQDVDTTRATYFAGKSAMLVWSSFLLDELAGLREDTLPSCPECKDDPGFLVGNTGVVTRFQGPDGTTGAQYGDETVFEIMADAHPETAALVRYLMSDAYLDWIRIAPEGKIPVRLGSAERPREYIDEWAKLDIGVDAKRPLDEVYGKDAVAAVRAGAEQFDRWGFGHSPRGGQLVGAALGQLPMTRAIGDVVGGSADVDQALETAQGSYEQLADKLR